jgi:hypothetical protein
LAAELRDTVAKLEVPKLRCASYVMFYDIVWLQMPCRVILWHYLLKPLHTKV